MNENCATLMYNDGELQTPESNACGYHVIAFCLLRINNMSHYGGNTLYFTRPSNLFTSIPNFLKSGPIRHSG